MDATKCGPTQNKINQEGGKNVYHKNLNKHINVRLTDSELISLNDMANERKMALSALIRYILKEYIRKYT